MARLVSPFKRIRCPTCFHDGFHPSDAPRRLVTGTRESDDFGGALGANVTIDLPPLIYPDRDPILRRDPVSRLLRRFVVSKLPISLGNKACPDCHAFLPPKLANAQCDMQTIAFLGVRDSGKSNFIGVLVKELERRYQREVGFELSLANYSLDVTVRLGETVTARDLHSRRYGCLFDREHPTRVPQTRDVLTDPDTRIPLICQLTFGRRFKRTILLSFYDTAGESWDKSSSWPYLRYIENAAGIVFLIDPFELPGIRQNIPRAARPPRPSSGLTAIGFLDLLVQHFNDSINLRKKLSVPVAYVIPKSDILPDLTDTEDPPYLRDIVHRNGFNEVESKQTTDALEAALSDWQPDGDIRRLMNSFTNHRFFAASALGQQPGPNGELARRVQPQGVADPFLWILYQLGVLRPSNDNVSVVSAST